MNNNFETRIIIYSLILGVMFIGAIILALWHRPGRNKRIANGES